MQCVPCIYAIHTLYSHGMNIVFNMIPRHLYWKLYSLVKYMTCLVIHTSTQRIAMTFIDVGYTCDVNTVTLHKMVIILFTVYSQLLAFSQCSDLSYINISKYAICCRASINLYLIQHVP